VDSSLADAASVSVLVASASAAVTLAPADVPRWWPCRPYLRFPGHV